MKNIVLYAPPAAGKGTQCELLVHNYEYNVISIGQVLRNARSTETEIGKIIIETQDKGILTPDNIVAEALKQELEKYKNMPIVIEGYPRNLEQAKLLDTVLNNYIVINLFIERSVAIERALGRLNCSNCGKNYNIFSTNMKPKLDGICDFCGAKLERRSDDNEKSFYIRFDVYEENAPKILEYYKNKNILYQVDSNHSKEVIWEDIKKILKEAKND